MIEGVMNRSHWNRSRRSNMGPPPANRATDGCRTDRLFSDIRPASSPHPHPPQSPATAVPRLHWEDFSPGNVTEYGPRLVTKDEIVAFAAAYDPQPMHLD